MTPRVSVVLPARDAEDTLDAAIASVRAQTLAAWELVVVPNACCDATEDIARRHAVEDPRVRVVRCDRPGVVFAANLGIDQARAPLVARLDADDRMLPERLARQVEAMGAHPEWSVCACGVRYEGALPRGGMARHVAWLNRLETPEALRLNRFVDAPVANPSTVVRRDVLRDIGGFRDGDFPEDYELWLRLFERGAVFGKVPDVLQVWCDPPERLTRTDPRYSDEAFRRTKHRYLLSGPLSGSRRARVWGAGRAGKRHIRELVAAGAAIDDAIDIDPKKIGGRVGGEVPVVGPDALGPPDGRLVLVAVATPGARAEIAARLEAAGYRPDVDWLPLQ